VEEKEGETWGFRGGEEVDLILSYTATYCRGGRVWSLDCIELTRRPLIYIGLPGLDL
jgi:hypothetical protein